MRLKKPKKKKQTNKQRRRKRTTLLSLVEKTFQPTLLLIKLWNKRRLSLFSSSI